MRASAFVTASGSGHERTTGCAFPGCGVDLLYPIDDSDDDTIVGVECHIVAQKDSSKVARSVSSLSENELEEVCSSD